MIIFFLMFKVGLVNYYQNVSNFYILLTSKELFGPDLISVLHCEECFRCPTPISSLST